MTDKPENYNLLVKPWIPILWTDGKPHRVGIRTALVEAGRIRQIAASNPMDNVALLCLLLAVLQWCKPSLTSEDRDRLERAGGIPDDWVQGILGTEREPSPAVDVLGGDARFYHDKPCKGSSSTAWSRTRKSRPGSGTTTSFARPSGNASSRRSARRPKLQADREEGRCHG